jgi:RNA polymerase sigma factor (sigma-70 family)
MSFEPSNNNHKEVISRLYTECKEGAVKWLLSKGVDKNEALDIYQNSVLAVAERLSKNGLEHFRSGIKAYLFSVTKYLFYDSIRRKGNGINLIGDDQAELEKLADLDDYHIETNDEILNLRHKLDQLDEKSYKLLRLFYYEDKSMREIAEIMGFSGEQVAKTTKYRIIQRLKKMLKQH